MKVLILQHKVYAPVTLKHRTISSLMIDRRVLVKGFLGTHATGSDLREN